METPAQPNIPDSKNKTYRWNGFTLVELIVVITILAILATIGFLALSGYSSDAKNAVVKTNVRSVYTAINLESTVSGNSPRYYVIHDDAAALTGAIVAYDGLSTPLTGGVWNAPNTNYSAGNPDYVKLKLNPEKFRVSKNGGFLAEIASFGFPVDAAYDSSGMTIGATDVKKTSGSNSFFQVAATDPTGTVVIVGNYAASSGSTAGLVDNPSASGSWALVDGQSITAGSSVTVNLSAATLPKGKLIKAYNSGSGFDMNSLLTVTGDPAYSPSLVTWTASGSLPSGLVLGSDGKITGTPTALNAGAAVQIKATYAGIASQQTYTMVVIDAVLEALQVSNGQNFACAVTLAGGAKCWGDNSMGQLGDGTTTARLTPVDVTGLTSGVAEIAAGSNFTCAVLTNGTIKCWGYNGYGQLGKWSGGNVTAPTLVSGIASWATHVTTGERHACAIVSGAAKCWGYNYSGQLGNGTWSDTNAPSDVTGLTSGVTSLVAGNMQTCAVVSWVAKCWGANGGYQLGDGTTTGRNSPVNVISLGSDIVAVSTGYANNSCAINSAGGLKCWGQGTGDGTATTRTGAVDVVGMTSGVAQVSDGYSHTCALTTSGVPKCWGNNGGNGRTGDGINYNNTTNSPTALSGLTTGVAAISAGQNGCALKTDNTVKCWGYYAGNNTSSAQYSPVSVME